MSANQYDTDDVNFTVTDYPKYSYWNLTDYTTGENISDYTVSRSDKINASVLWDKNISYAILRHNGTGTFQNYTFYAENEWTNYTLNISNVTEFSRAGTIEISSMWANDSYGLENYTSNAYHLNLPAGDPPNVTDFFFSYSDRTDVSNKYTEVVIFANVSDDVGISAVIANITYPNGNSTNASMVVMENQCNYLPEWCGWQYTFGDYDIYLNETGNYTVRITAIDIGNQSKISGVDEFCPENKILTVSSNYNLNLTSNYSVYMRGENVTLEAKNIFNTYETGNINWTVNVTKINEVYNFSVIQDVFNYTIRTDDSEGNYSLFANASKNNNSGNYTWDFNVSKTFAITIAVAQTSPSPSSTLTVNAHIYNARGETYLPQINASITCKNSNNVYTMSSLTFNDGQASSSSCYASSTHGTSFTITINASDQNNNTGTNSTTLTTTPAPLSTGGGGGFSLPDKEKNCTDGTLYNQCSSKRPFYCKNGVLVRNCSVCGCNIGRCQLDGSCALVKEEDFNFTLERSRIEIVQGMNANLTGLVRNTGNTTLNLVSFLNVSGNCCQVYMPSSFTLKEKEEKIFEIDIHVPLTTNIGEYPTIVGIGTGYFKERTFYVIVKASPHYNALNELNSSLNEIEKKIEEYKAAGVDTRSLEALVQQSKASLNNANASISNDQASALQNSLSDLKNNVDYANSKLETLRAQKFIFQNGWLIGLFLIMSLTTMYMVPTVLVPLSKKDKELTELKREEEALVISRVETEKQYFMRKMDENTFSKIMITKQDRILKVRAMIKERENERSKIIKSISPIAMFVWFGRGIKSIPKRIANIPKRIFKRKDNIDKDGKAQ